MSAIVQQETNEMAGQARNDAGGGGGRRARHEQREKIADFYPDDLVSGAHLAPRIRRKIRASMTLPSLPPYTPRHHRFQLARRSAWGVGAALALALALPALAEKSDRYKPLSLAADQQGTLDMAKKTAVFKGNVVVTKGTILMEADRVEIRELPNGSRQATAFGSAARQATFKQARDKPNEFIFGKADRLEYDEKTGTVRFVSRAVAQRLIGELVADEIAGDLLIYDNQAEFFSASSAPSHSPGAGTGRVRVILSPREATPATSSPPPQGAEPAEGKP